MFNKLINFLFGRNKDTYSIEDIGDNDAVWYQRYFEIYCSKCGEEAPMKHNHSGYYYTRTCPHCTARMLNATTRGYDDAMAKYHKIIENPEIRAKLFKKEV